VDLEGEGLALPGARVARVGLAGFVRGALGRPEVDLRAGVERVALPGEGTVLRGLDLHVRGGPRQGSGARYALTLDTRAPAGRRATLEGALRLERPLTAAAPAGVASLEGELEGLWPSTLRVAARELRFRGDALSLEALEVRAARGPLALDAAGSLRGDLADARLSLVGLDARELLHAVQRAAPGTEERLRAELGGLPTGRLELEARVSGRPSAPDLEARLAGTGVIVGPLEVPRFELRAAHRSLERGARAEALVDVAAAGIGTLTLEASLASTRRRLAGLLRDPEARVDARLLAPGVDLQELAERANELGAGLPPLGGVVVLDGAVGGALGGLPDGRVAARAVALRVDYGDPVDLQADVDLGAPSGAAGEEPVRLRASARDRLGELFRGDVAVDVAPLLRGAAFAEALERVPFALRATLSERRADELPRPFAPALAVRASADVELSAEEGAPVQGRVTARAAFLDAACEGVETPPELDLSLALGEARGELVLRAALAGEPAFAFRAEAPAPLRRWVGMGGPAEAPPLSVRGGGRGVPLEHVPVLCEDAAGTLDLTLDAAELGSSEPRVALQATARGARVRGAAPILVGLQAALSGAQADLDVRIVEGERPALTLVAAAPLRTPAGVPELDPERPWSLSLDADAAPFAPLVAAVPDVVDPSGALDGALRVGGTGATVTDASGELRFDAVAFTIREPFQRIQRLDGGLALRDADAGGRGLVFEGLRIRDRDGSASLDGRIDTDASFRPRSAGLTLEMRRFPVRDEGIPIAYVDATARLDAEVREGLAQARVRMRNAAVAVPPDEGRVALGLAGHPDVTYEDEPGFGAAPFAAALPELEAPPDEREEEDDDALPHRLVLRFESSPFFVRRDDFAIQLEPDVTVRADAERATVGGPVIVRRGYLELLGKRFELQRGEILFTGSAEIDPELDLTARHELGSDETVGVRITGTLVRPELAFTSSEEGLTEQEILDRLVRGRQSGGADQTANDQARSVLAGLTAGFLSQIARRRFGSYVPVLAIESDGTNQAQVRAGFSLDRLIPRWLEPVLEGVYVEGVFGVEGEGEDAEQTGASFSTSALIELLFPRRFVGTAVVDQQANWSIDVTWEP
ncbi:MAG: translocation/assembly module TamB domain-containing protein, partial [Myxococcota bacterium]